MYKKWKRVGPDIEYRPEGVSLPTDEIINDVLDGMTLRAAGEKHGMTHQGIAKHFWNHGSVNRPYSTLAGWNSKNIKMLRKSWRLRQGAKVA